MKNLFGLFDILLDHLTEGEEMSMFWITVVGVIGALILYFM